MIENLSTVILVIVVSVTVSIDVIGLTFAKSQAFAGESLKQKVFWGIYNGAWHAILLLLYLGVIEITVSFLFHNFFLVHFKQFVQWFTYPIFFCLNWILGFFQLSIDIASSVEAVFRLIQDHLVVIIGTIALIVVWGIYSNKLTDSPGDTDGDDVDKLPALAAITFAVQEVFVRIYLLALHRSPLQNDPLIAEENAKRFLYRNFQAALVAVDMLALAIILKSLGYIGDPSALGIEQSTQALNPWWLGFSVFSIVGALAFGTAVLGGRLFKELETESQKNTAILRNLAPNSGNRTLCYKTESLNFIKIFLRIAEPFLIFYFVMQLIVLLIHQEVEHSVGLLFGSSLFLVALLTKQAFSQVVKSALTEDKKGSEGKSEIRTWEQLYKPVGSIFVNCGRMLIALTFVMVGLILMVPFLNFLVPLIINFSSYSGSLEGSQTSLDSLILAMFSFYLFFGRMILHVFSEKTLIKCDKKMYNLLCEMSVPLFFIGVSFLVAFSLPLFRELSEDVSNINLDSARFHALQFAAIISILSGFMLTVKRFSLNKKDRPNWFFGVLAAMLMLFSVVSQIVFEMALI